jgi:hypothetical protein
MTSELHILHRKYGRPKMLSDPFHDNTPAGLRELVAKPDERLGWGDFKDLLGPDLPAGTYDEVVYFLPLAFDHVRAKNWDALDLCSSLAWFCSEYSDRLASDNVVEAARAELGALLREWTARFAIVHFDKSACASKGWSLGHFDLVEMSETVCEMLCDLVRYTRHADIAEQFIVDLVNFDANPVVAAWLLELIRSREDVAYRPPLLPRLEEASTDHRLLRTAYESTQTNEQIRESSPTYWRDTLSKLGIA